MRKQEKNELKNALFVKNLNIYFFCFECILHISYRLPIERWDIRGDEAKKLCAVKKKKVQTEFWQQLGLLVDFPKDSGSGIFI